MIKIYHKAHISSVCVVSFEDVTLKMLTEIVKIKKFSNIFLKSSSPLNSSFYHVTPTNLKLFCQDFT